MNDTKVTRWRDTHARILILSPLQTDCPNDFQMNLLSTDFRHAQAHRVFQNITHTYVEHKSAGKVAIT